jgi:hypothetical protein
VSSLRDTLNQIRAQYASQEQLGPKSLGEEIGGIPGSIIANALDLFGVPKSAEQLAYDKKYPITSLATGLVGFGGPYMAAWKGISGIKKLDNAINSIGDIAASPIKTQIMRDTAKMGVIEGGRLAINQAIPGGESFGDAFADSALNLGFTVAGSGVLGALSQGGPRNAPLQEIFKDINMDAAPQVQARQLSEALKNNQIDPKFTADARNRIQRLGDQIRTEKRETYVGPTLKTGGKRINRMFKLDGKDNSIIRRRFARTESGGFPTDAAWQGAARAAGMPDDWTLYSQFPRHITFKTEDAAKSLQNTVNQTMQSAGDGWYVTQELNDGLFVMAKRAKGLATKSTKDDQWVVFKTDTPGHFLPMHEKWGNAVSDHVHFLAKDVRPQGPVGDIFDTARKMMETLPLRKYVGSGAHAGTAAAMASKLGSVLGLDGALKNTGEVTKRVRDAFTEYLAPTVQQFGRSPRAGRVFAIASATNDAAESVTRKLVYGETSLDPSKDAIHHLLVAPAELKGDSIKALIDKLSDEEITQFHQLWKNEATPDLVREMFAEGKITQGVKDFAERVQAIDDELGAQIIRTEEATGGGKFQPRLGHFGLSRLWDGDLRVAIRDAEDNLIGVASGHSRQSAKRHAEKLSQQLEAEGKVARIAEEFDITETAKLPRDLTVHVNSPAWLLERQNIRGYKYDDVAFTRKELLDEFASGVRKRTKYMANRSVTDLLADDIAKVAVEDPQMHRVLVDRLNDLAGKRSPFTKFQDQVVDQVLGPVLGKNTASKVVSATNQLMWHLELGAMRMAYPVMNMLTFAQTVLPEVAFVANSSPDVLAKYYSTYLSKTPKSARPFGVLDPMKMWWQGTRNMRSKDASWIKSVERGINEGVLDPRFIEESVGQNSKMITNWRETLKNKDGFWQFVQQVSEFLPAQSEKFSRLNAFSTGHVFGKEVLGIVDDELLYKFAKDFTDRTMFRYGMEARPRVFTTPAGSAIGLFKNWMFHYMGMMADYAGEGLLRNNWSPLLWQTAGTFAVGGLAASPVYAVANTFSEAMAGKSALQNVYDTFEWAPDRVSDAIMFGLPAGMAGISLSGAATAPFANPARDVTQMFSLVHAQRIKALGDTFTGGLEHFNATGESPLADANTRDMLFRAVAPKVVYRGLQVAQDDTIKSLATGYPVMKGVGPFDQFMFTLGFNPTQIEKGYAVADELWKDQQKMRTAVASYGEALYQAYSQGDMASIDQIMQRALMEGVDLSSIERSALAREGKANKDIVTRQFKPEEVEQRLNVLGDSYEVPQ